VDGLADHQHKSKVDFNFFRFLHDFGDLLEIRFSNMATCDFFFSQHMATCAALFFSLKKAHIEFPMGFFFFFFFFLPGDRHSLKIHPG
jgi:hypothetical protein